jgi:hypothetical protein
MNIREALNEIRRIMSRCNASEKELYEALCEEAEGWQMRLQELQEEDEDAAD